nr:polyamine ABC transporter substrate-binding protein [uncultured Gellertiella sp.]
MKLSRRAALATLAGGLAMPFVRPSYAGAGTVNIDSWADYIGETTLADFEKETGITPVYDTYSSYEEVEAKLLAGGTGYDVVDVAGRSMPALLKAGILDPLDRSKLPLWKNLDPELLKILEPWDPGAAHSAPYMWGSVGFTFNADMVRKRIPNADFEDLDLIFKPENANLLADCGVTVHDSPRDIVPILLKYLGEDPDTTDISKYQKVVDLFAGVRKDITAFDNENYLTALPNQQVCVANTWSGDYAVAKKRAKDAGIDLNLVYAVPKTGAPLWFDVMCIPKDAPNKDNAHAFLNYLMKPEVIAACTNFIGYANANKAARPFVSPAVLADPAIYPDAATLKRLWAPKALNPDQDRALTRLFEQIKSG